MIVVLMLLLLLLLLEGQGVIFRGSIPVQSSVKYVTSADENCFTPEAAAGCWWKKVTGSP